MILVGCPYCGRSCFEEDTVSGKWKQCYFCGKTIMMAEAPSPRFQTWFIILLVFQILSVVGLGIAGYYATPSSVVAHPFISACMVGFYLLNCVIGPFRFLARRPLFFSNGRRGLGRHSRNLQKVRSPNIVILMYNYLFLFLSFFLINRFLYATAGPYHYYVQHEPHWYDWLIYTTGHFLRGGDLLDALAEYGVTFVDLGVKSTLAALVLVSFHVAVSCSLLAPNGFSHSDG